MNGAFIQNMIGKSIRYEDQPSAFGRGKIAAMTARKIKVRKFILPEGNATIEYEVFDLEVAVDEGRYVGARMAGVAVPETIRDMAGQRQALVGATYGQIWDAVNEDRPIVFARCG